MCTDLSGVLHLDDQLRVRANGEKGDVQAAGGGRVLGGKEEMLIDPDQYLSEDEESMAMREDRVDFTRGMRSLILKLTKPFGSRSGEFSMRIYIEKMGIGRASSKT